jgi:uncharacterized C2H2 Zn-finger protein
MYICVCCDYKTDRKDAYIRHKKSNKHIKNDTKNKLPTIDENDEELEYSEKSNTIKSYKCDKCDKMYACKKNYEAHYNKCNFAHSLQCPRCFKVFSKQQSKSKHILNGKCKHVSTLKSKQINNNNSNNNITNSNNTNIINNNNTINNINNVNMYINNYGKERTDYITDEMFVNDVLKSVFSHMVCAYLEIKHFNELFPENHNIKHANNKFWIKHNNKWRITSLEKLSEKLYTNNVLQICNRMLTSKNNLTQIFTDEQIQQLQNEVNFTYLKQIKKDKLIKTEIIDSINTNLVYKEIQEVFNRQF